MFHCEVLLDVREREESAPSQEPDMSKKRMSGTVTPIWSMAKSNDDGKPSRSALSSSCWLSGNLATQFNPGVKCDSQNKDTYGQERRGVAL